MPARAATSSSTSVSRDGMHAATARRASTATRGGSSSSSGAAASRARRCWRSAAGSARSSSSCCRRRRAAGQRRALAGLRAVRRRAAPQPRARRARRPARPRLRRPGRGAGAGGRRRPAPGRLLLPRLRDARRPRGRPRARPAAADLPARQLVDAARPRHDQPPPAPAAQGFRVYLHEPAAILDVASSHGLELATRERGAVWELVSLQRSRLAPPKRAAVSAGSARAHPRRHLRGRARKSRISMRGKHGPGRSRTSARSFEGCRSVH